VSTTLLRKEGLPELTGKDYYNLNRREGNRGKLTKIEEIRVILEHLEAHNFHAQVCWEYTVANNGEKTEERVIRDIFFINKAQIRIGRRNDSGESGNNENENEEPRRSGRARKRTTKIAEESQLQREQRQRRERQRAQKDERKVRRLRRLSASQLLDGFNFP